MYTNFPDEMPPEDPADGLAAGGALLRPRGAHQRDRGEKGCREVSEFQTRVPIFT